MLNQPRTDRRGLEKKTTVGEEGPGSASFDNQRKNRCNCRKGSCLGEYRLSSTSGDIERRISWDKSIYFWKNIDTFSSFACAEKRVLENPKKEFSSALLILKLGFLFYLSR